MKGRPRAASTRAIGIQAEAIARQFLESRGLDTIALNYRCRLGEIDLVMRQGREVVLVEVRYRRNPDPVEPWATVTMSKQRKLMRAAAHFLQAHREFADQPVRFDVLAISGPLTTPCFQWFRAGFDTGDVARN